MLPLWLKPSVISVDFEIAIRNMIKSVWPNTKINSFAFHLHQAYLLLMIAILKLENGLDILSRWLNSIAMRWKIVLFLFNIVKAKYWAYYKGEWSSLSKTNSSLLVYYRHNFHYGVSSACWKLNLIIPRKLLSLVT